MAELNKSALNTEEFHCLDFLLLGARNELCNLYLNCITYCNFTEIFIHCIYWNIYLLLYLYMYFVKFGNFYYYFL